MVTKIWMALALGATFMVAGLATVAAGNMYGDLDQTQTQDRLQDGSCDTTLEDDTCDSCNDYDFLYGETDLEPPHQSACGQE